MKWKTLLPAGLLAASLITVVYRSGTDHADHAAFTGQDQAKGASQAVAEETKKVEVSPHKTQQRALATATDQMRPDLVLRQLGDTQKERVWEGVKLGSLAVNSAATQKGEALEVSLGAMKVPGEVFFRTVDETGTETLGMNIAGDGYLFATTFADGRVNGTIRWRKGLSGYVLSGSKNDITLTRKTTPEAVCASIDTSGKLAKGFQTQQGSTFQNLSTPPIPPIQVPLLNSDPSSPYVLYLDFSNTDRVTNTQWNLEFNTPEIRVVAPYYTQDELIEMWEMIADDFAPFRINVTTDKARYLSAAAGRRQMVRFTADDSWYVAQEGAGTLGVCYLNSFNSGDDQPLWIFTKPTEELSDLGAMMANLAEVTSHESGHAFGLEHDGINPPGLEYYGGDGIWGPIMGNPFNTPVTQWSNGDYPGATNQEDDYAIISGPTNFPIVDGFNTRNGMRTDDHGNTITNPSKLLPHPLAGLPPANPGDPVVPLGTVETQGIQEERDDQDVFRFTTGGGTIDLEATSIPEQFESEANLIGINITDFSVGDVACSITVVDPNGQILGTETAPYGQKARLTLTNVPGGIYYAIVRGVGDTIPHLGRPPTVFSDYGSRGYYHIHGFVDGLNGAVVELTQPSVESLRIEQGHGLVMSAKVSNSTQGSSVQWVSTPAGVVFSSPNALDTRASFPGVGQYTVECQVTSNGVTTKDSATVNVVADGSVIGTVNTGPRITLNVPSTVNNAFQAPLASTVADEGIFKTGQTVPSPGPLTTKWFLIEGFGQILSPTALNASLVYEQGGTFKVIQTATDSQIQTFKEATIVAQVKRSTAVGEDKPAYYYVPLNATFDSTWKQNSFVPTSAWTLGKLGAGFFTGSTNSKNYQLQYVDPTMNLKTPMLNKATSAYVRIPFQVADKNAVFAARVKMRYDDGYVIYLNGTEIGRMNAPSGTPTWQSKATKSRPLLDIESVYTVSDSRINNNPNILNLLQTGTNILSVHGMNYTKSDADFLVLPEVQLDSSTSGLAAMMVKNGEEPVEPDPLADSDGDGVNNLTEYATGTNPLTQGASKPIALVNGKLTFGLPVDVPSDVTYFVEASSNLSSWSTVASKIGGAAWAGNLPVTVLADGQVEINVGNAGQQQFYRLRYELAPVR